MTIPDPAQQNPFDHGEGCQEDAHDFEPEIPPNLYHEAAERFMTFADRRDAFICGFKGNTMLAYFVTLLALEKFHLLGCSDDVQLARRFGVTKQHINKIKMDFLKSLGLIDEMGQRTEADRKAFSEARKAQLA